ncbi:MAG: CHAT domain-containing protein, partial [Pseudomonadota bacterium]|nr:CHAT domain-containing protein [Pseudomonadota bacterium]
GEFNPEEPLSSRLLLVGDESNDGSLTVGELYDLELNSELVTLSACQTGLGDVQSGDDVIGLTRGFLFAGAANIVASLWMVDDEATARLMVNLYNNLQSQDKQQSLRNAQLSVKNNYQAHPYYWAAFQLTGAGR